MAVAHTRVEFNELCLWNEVEADSEDYFNRAKSDLLNLIIVYGGSIRLRDVRHCFEKQAEYDLDLDRLQMQSWAAFLIAVGKDVAYKKDFVKDEVVIFVAQKTRGSTFARTGHLQSMIISTPNKGPETCQLQNLEPIELDKAFLEGYMDCADGVEMKDPRIPIQDLGVNATAIREGSRKKRYNNRKQTWEEQIAQKPARPMTTFESTEPIPSTKKGSLALFCSSLQSMISAEAEGNENGDIAQAVRDPVVPVTVPTTSAKAKQQEADDDWDYSYTERWVSAQTQPQRRS